MENEYLRQNGYQERLENQRILFVLFATVIGIAGILFAYRAITYPSAGTIYNISSIYLGLEWLGVKNNWVMLPQWLISPPSNYLSLLILVGLACSVFVNQKRVIKEPMTLIILCGVAGLLGLLCGYFVGFASPLIAAFCLSFYEGYRANRLAPDISAGQAISALTFLSIIFGAGFSISTFPVAGVSLAIAMMVVSALGFWLIGQDKLLCRPESVSK